ncbi:transcriptional regulator with XRE-family HTH domain [Filimonas zeae]|uniref:HTH cro/C1-type domain-containing protein n=1 Tax=Filimonas zeae TaxID=1737353 RepID=A0A917IXL9_9BACT|nr:helix-turn-helix transcriptional regulator [Filimonas zeae]MDR6338969.1 transcriptional regulator with XRE-family HTH domain [Filimonas zeae]GGH65728.1 hypothetical protein GCM10011379_19170 [Filimonas zeae]
MTPEQIRAEIELQPTGEKIRTTRKQLTPKLSQKELAALCNLHYNHLGKVERGASNVDLLTLIKVSFAVQLPVFEHLRLPASAIKRKLAPTDKMISHRLRRVLKIIANCILQLLKQKNMSQEALASAMDIDRSEINKYVHGRINMQYTTLVRIAMHLEVETQALLKPQAA